MTGTIKRTFLPTLLEEFNMMRVARVAGAGKTIIHFTNWYSKCLTYLTIHWRNCEAVFFLLKKMSLVCTKTWRFYFSKVPPITCSNNFPSFFRGPVTINMGLGLWECSDGPVKSATGPWSRWRAHIFTDGEKQVKFSMAKPVQSVTGPRIRWRAHEKMTEKYTKVAILSML